MSALVIFSSLLAVALWELCGPRRRREFPAARRRLGNLAFWLVNLLLAAFVFMPAQGARRQIEAVFGLGLPSWPIGNMAVSLAAGFLLLDLLRYAVHRFEHAVPWLWRLHALHHSDPEIDVTTSVRHHPFEYLVTSAVYWIALIVLDVPAFIVLIHGLAVFGTAAIQHGNIRLPARLERWLQPLVMTPDLHRIHHSVVLRESNANYGAVLSLWDRLLGTAVTLTRAQHEAIVYGVRELPARDCLKPSAMLLTPWRLARAQRAEPAGLETRNR